MTDSIHPQLAVALGKLAERVDKVNSNIVTVSRNQVYLARRTEEMITKLDTITAAVKLAETTITDQRAQLTAKDVQIADLTAKLAAGDHLTDADVDALAKELTDAVNPPAAPAA